jgi:hypothetical protein
MANAVQHLIDSVARAWGFVDVIPSDRTRDAIGARLCCFVKLRSYGFSLHAIARQMNCDHTTVLYWLNKVPEDLAVRIRQWDPEDIDETLGLMNEVNDFLRRTEGRKEVSREHDRNSTTVV